MPSGGIIIGVDLAPIKAIPRCTTFQADITTDKCRATIRSHLKTWKADTVLHDGAPNVGTAWVQDAFSQAELVLESLKLATEFLAEGGTFVTKVFRSKDYNPLLWVFNQLFTKVEATKPPSSRAVSAEIFVVCRGYKAPKKLDPKFLDPRSVFAELADPAPNNEAKVFKPEQKKRKRQGYEEGDWTQFKEAPASEFIHTDDPIAMLGNLNKLSFELPPNGDLALATLLKLPETTTEIMSCCTDLKVLGRGDFKRLLKWRLKVREVFGFASKSKPKEEEQEEVAEVEPMDEELRIQEEMQKLHEKDTKKKRKERRKDNEQKQKDTFRMQMHMTTPYELGTEQAGPMGDGAIFDIKAVDKSGAASHIARGRMHTVVDEEKKAESEEEDWDSDSDGDLLEGELDAMYDQYRERKSSQDAKYRAKKARTEFNDDEWEGVSNEENEEREFSSDDENLVEDDQSDESDDEGPLQVVDDLEREVKVDGKLSRKAALFFDQDIFRDIPGVEGEDSDSGIAVEDSPEIDHQPLPKRFAFPVMAELSDSDSNDGIEFVKETRVEQEDAWDSDPEPVTRDGRPDIDIITAEAMTLAHRLATGGAKAKADLKDENFNKYTFRDVDGLPDWFLDDENQHSTPHKPITAAAAAAIKEKMRAFNARPIKKVAEAAARKKFKAAQRMEKLKKKSEGVLEDEGMTEGDKARAVARVMSRASKAGKQRRQVKVVVAKGGNRGLKGRPKGTKGRYKMVDSRMKKDVRAEKRLKKKIAGKR
jgi:AdoMet-dependent rRNA methyltransferase SPB1